VEGLRRRVAYDSEDVAQTDASGLFEFRYVPTDATVTFITIPDGGQPHESAGVVIPLSVPDSVPTVDLAVPFVPASSLDGSIVSHDGSGTGFAHIHVSTRRALVGRLSDSAIHHLSLLGMIERSTTADANGRFWFQGLPSGEVDVRVRSGDGARARHVVSTAPGGEARLDFVVSRGPARLY
jgi:hypothetical protein